MASWRDFLRGPERKAPTRVEPWIPHPTVARFTAATVADVRARLASTLPTDTASAPVQSPFALPKYAPGVLPAGMDATKLAMDEASITDTLAWARGNWYGAAAEGIGFFGYPYLAELNQRPEYRRASEVIAEEMTRKWVNITSTGDEDASDRITVIKQKLEHFNVRDLFFEAMLYDGQYGQSFVFPDLGDRSNDERMASPLILSKDTIERGSLKRFALIDPMWMAPLDYNSMDPTDPTFYRPQTWFVMGRRFSHTRLMQFNSRPLADILKPAYNFGGLSLTQMLKPYVDNWLRTRQSVSDLLNSFTIWVLETNLMSRLSPQLAPGSSADVDNLQNRLEIFSLIKNVRGVAAIDKTTEALTNVSAPLGTLDHLQAQAQEHMSAITGIPLVKALGITPSGLNASSDGEIRSFYDSINARQPRVMGHHLKTIIELIQLDEFGDVNRNIVANWLPLWELDEAGRASVRKIDADTGAVLIETGVIDADEERQRIKNAQDTLYANLDGSAPGPPEAGEGEHPDLSDPAEHIGRQGAEGSTSGANKGDAALGTDAGRPGWRGDEDDSFLPALLRGRVTVRYLDLLPDGEQQAGYFEPRKGDAWGMGDGSGSITLARRITLSPGDDRAIATPLRVRTHETGHAMDHALGGASSLLELPRPGERETPAEAVGTAYYLDDPKEAFAEGYATLNCPDDEARYFGGMSRSRAMELFGDFIEDIRQATT